MSWETSRLDALGGVENLTLLVPWGPGEQRAVTVWVVAAEGELWVRSYRGVGSSWYSHASSARRGWIRVEGGELPVLFEPAAETPVDAINAAYRAKYDRYSYVDAILGQGAIDATIRIRPVGVNER